MNYHNITKEDMLNGEGLRTVLWVAGCNHYCKGCQNPETWDACGGIPFDDAARQEIMESLPEKIYYMLEHQSPYRTDPVMIKRIYISCILTFNENITLKKKVEITEEDSAERSVKKMADAFLRNKQSVIL